jgi:hypothetical protein
MQTFPHSPTEVQHKVYAKLAIIDDVQITKVVQRHLFGMLTNYSPKVNKVERWKSNLGNSL